MKKKILPSFFELWKSEEGRILYYIVCYVFCKFIRLYAYIRFFKIGGEKKNTHTHVFVRV